MHACIHTYIHTCLLLLISMLWHRQAIFKSKGDKLSSSAECRIRTHQGLRHQIASRLNARWQTDWAIEDQTKTWTRQPVPMISEHSAHSTPQPLGIRTWLWRYTCLLLHTYIHTYIHACMRACVCAWCVRTYVRTYVNAYKYTYRKCQDHVYTRWEYWSTI